MVCLIKKYIHSRREVSLKLPRIRSYGGQTWHEGEISCNAALYMFRLVPRPLSVLEFIYFVHGASEFDAIRIWWTNES